MRVRVATDDDVEAIRRVHEASIRGLAGETYEPEQVDAWAAGVESADYAAVSHDDYYFTVAEDDAVVGFGTLAREPPDGYEADVDAAVTAVYVHPDVARDGVGAALLDDLERRARVEGVERRD